jgi:parallel beta-helix repeat protein
MSVDRELTRARNKADAAKAKSERAAARLEQARQRAGRQQETSKSHRPRVVGALVLLGVVGVGLAAWQHFANQDRRDRRPRAELAEIDGVGEAVLVNGGVVTMADLAGMSALEQAVRAEDGRYLVSLPIVVAPGTELSIERADVLLESNPEAWVGIELRGGTLVLARSSITAYDSAAGEPDTNASGGRAYVLATGAGSRVVATGSSLHHLGYEAEDRTGLTITDGAEAHLDGVEIMAPYVGLTADGAVDITAFDVIVSDALATGVDLASASGVRLTRGTVARSAGDGILVRGSSADASIEQFEVRDSSGAGIAVIGSAGELSLEANLAHGNQRAGIFLSNTRGVRVEGNSVWRNGEHGISLSGANASTSVSGNRVSANSGSGIAVLGAGTAVEITANVVDHHDAGIAVSEGDARLLDNELMFNTVGVSIDDRTPRVTLEGNVITDSADTSVRLTTPSGVEMRDNTLERNERATFAVETAEDSAAFLDGNRVEAGLFGTEVVLGPERSAEQVADVTPLPLYFFGVPGEQVSQIETATDG